MKRKSLLLLSLSLLALGSCQKEASSKLLASNGTQLSANLRDSTSLPPVTLPVTDPPAARDSDATTFLNGSYLGTVLKHVGNHPDSVRKFGVKLQTGTFASIDVTGGVPAGKGTFTISVGKLNFVNKQNILLYLPGPGSDLIDYSYLLSGTYSSIIKGDSLILSKGNRADSLIVYKLKKQ